MFLCDDHSVFRAGVRAELSAAGPQVSIVGEGGTVAECVEGICATRPDVVLLDVHMPDGGGLAIIRQVAGRGCATTFLALSVSDAAEDVIAVIRAGARGYVTKSISGPELVDAVCRVDEGDAVFSPRLAGFVLDAFCAPDAHAGAGVVDGPGEAESVEPVRDPAVDALTRRELEVLRYLARGYTYKEIAAELFISIKTVETHASNILRKTQVSNRYALTKWAHDRRLD